jgi:HAD superfamily hydrolase (TIGR01549 family)
MKLKAVLFDLDGTLIDSSPLILKSIKETLNHFNFKCSNQKLRLLSQGHSRDIAYYFMDKNKVSFDVHDFVEFRRKSFINLLHSNPDHWFKDSKDFLKDLSKDYKIAIVTGSRWGFVKESFDKKTKCYVDYIVTSDDVEHKKPDIQPIEKTLKKLNLKKEEVIFIGDSIQDGIMCIRSGIRFIAKPTGVSTSKELKKFNPIFTSKNLYDIHNFIKKLD